MKEKRLEELLYAVCGYLAELNDEFLSYKHNKICYGMTREEHNKYFLGK